MDQSIVLKDEIRMLTHEMANPVHVLKFCVSELVKNPDRVNQQDFSERMMRNMTAIEEVFEKIRNLVRTES